VHLFIFYILYVYVCHKFVFHILGLAPISMDKAKRRLSAGAADTNSMVAVKLKKRLKAVTKHFHDPQLRALASKALVDDEADEDREEGDLEEVGSPFSRGEKGSRGSTDDADKWDDDFGLSPPTVVVPTLTGGKIEPKKNMSSDDDWGAGRRQYF
jgi:hypothetical protein